MKAVLQVRQREHSPPVEKAPQRKSPTRIRLEKRVKQQAAGQERRGLDPQLATLDSHAREPVQSLGCPHREQSYVQAVRT